MPHYQHHSAARHLASHVSECLPNLIEKNIAVGFDGFVDTIVRVVKDKGEDGKTFISAMGDFGEYITARKGHNFFVELEEVVTKSGGNMPNFAHALAQFGCNISCVGALGYPSPHQAFRSLPSNCQLYGYADPGITTALEFDDGKMMMSQIGSLNQATWSTVSSRLGQQVLQDIFSSSRLIGILNWGELDNATAIWSGLLDNILAKITSPEKKQIVFFDLCDCSGRTRSAVLEVLQLIVQYGRHCTVILSLNSHEAGIVATALGGNKEETPQGQGDFIAAELDIDGVLIHHAQEAWLWTMGERFSKKSFFTATPKISTGAGDNFNAGFCAGWLMELHPADCLVMGHATATCYLQTGESPRPEKILDLIKSSIHTTYS